MKRYLMGACAVVLAISFSAFTGTTKEVKRVGQWYRYTSGTFTADAQKTPANYTPEAFATCPSAAKLCRLFIDPAFDGNASSLSEADILNVIQATGTNDIDANNDGVVDTEKLNISELQP